MTSRVFLFYLSWSYSLLFFFVLLLVLAIQQFFTIREIIFLWLFIIVIAQIETTYHQTLAKYGGAFFFPEIVYQRLLLRMPLENYTIVERISIQSRSDGTLKRFFNSFIFIFVTGCLTTNVSYKCLLLRFFFLSYTLYLQINSKIELEPLGGFSEMILLVLWKSVWCLH